MARLRDAYDSFVERKSVVMIVGPETPESFDRYWANNNIPFVGLPDPDHRVLKLYGQKVSLFKLGRMPAQVIVDMDGFVRFVHYGHSMKDIPRNSQLFSILDKLNGGVYN